MKREISISISTTAATTETLSTTTTTAAADKVAAVALPSTCVEPEDRKLLQQVHHADRKEELQESRRNFLYQTRKSNLVIGCLGLLIVMAIVILFVLVATL